MKKKSALIIGISAVLLIVLAVLCLIFPIGFDREYYEGEPGEKALMPGYIDDSEDNPFIDKNYYNDTDSTDTTEPQGDPNEITITPLTQSDVTVKDKSGRIQLTEFSTYTGRYVEDGTDDYVENVAAMLATNVSNEYLEYSVITFKVTDGDDEVAAAFTVTALAPGESAWIMEKNRLVISADATYEYKDDVTSFAKRNPSKDGKLEVSLGEGQVTLRNITDTDYQDIYLYYKNTHTDGNYLGGATYRLFADSLGTDAEAVVVAENADESCRLVRVDLVKKD